MATIKTLLKKYCPNGVEYKTLGEIATEIYRGGEIDKSQVGTGDYPCTTYGSLSNAFEIWFDKCNFGVNKDLIKNPKYFEHGDLLFVAASQVLRCIGDCCAYVGNEKGISGGATIVMKHNQNPKYIAYALSTEESKKQKERYSKIGAVINLTSENLKRIKIPLPPLEIQAKIADILDRFRELGKFLKKELEIRKKQYEFYRDKLIVGGGVDGSNAYCEWKTLGEIATEVSVGNELEKKQLGTGIYPCTTRGSITNAFEIWFDRCNFGVDKNLIKSPKFFEKNDLLFVGASQSYESIGDCCAYLGKEKGIAGENVFVVKHNQNAKYLSYSFSTTEAKKQKKKYATFGTVAFLKKETIKKIQIPLPPLEIQEQIAEQLDIFRSLCNDITVGIPREIELNQKRYEYYRDLLITNS